MRSFKYPNMFKVNASEVWDTSEYAQATLQNAGLVLRSFRNELLGDPYFGNTLQQYMFEPNNYLLKDVIIDTIYPQLIAFMPQLKIQRKDIEVVQDIKKGTLNCKFVGVSQIDYQLYTYETVLISNSDL